MMKYWKPCGNIQGANFYKKFVHLHCHCYCLFLLDCMFNTNLLLHLQQNKQTNHRSQRFILSIIIAIFRFFVKFFPQFWRGPSPPIWFAFYFTLSNYVIRMMFKYESFEVCLSIFVKVFFLFFSSLDFVFKTWFCQFVKYFVITLNACKFFIHLGFLMSIDLLMLFLPHYLLSNTFT